MGLDAVVYCDCFEAGRLRSPPPAGCHLSVFEDGSLSCGSDDLDVQLAFDSWHYDQACEHERGLLVHHRIGNISLVAVLRGVLQRSPDKFPMLLTRVLYNGIHGGDFIAAADLRLLRREVTALAEVRCVEPDEEQLIRNFESQMVELVEAGTRVGKAVVF